MKHKWLRTLCACAAALALLIGIATASPLIADARGIGESSFSFASPKIGYTSLKNSYAGESAYTGVSASYSSIRFFFFPSFWRFRSYGGYGYRSSAGRILRDIVIIAVVIVVIRWIIRRRRWR